MRLIILALLLTACQTAPIEIQALKQRVDNRLTYQNYQRKDYRYLPNGGEGNCATYAYNYYRDALKAGYEAEIIIKDMPKVGPHAFTVIDGKWVLDNRLGWVPRF